MTDEEHSENRGEGAAYEAGFERADELAKAFAQSPQAQALPAAMLADAERIAGAVLSYAWEYGETRPEDLDEDSLRQVLLSVMPGKFDADRATFERVMPVTFALLAYLGSEGILRMPRRVLRGMATWDRVLMRKVTDPTRTRSADGAAAAAAPRRPARVGRNDPCPCGSGRKWKHCCGRPGAKKHPSVG